MSAQIISFPKAKQRRAKAKLGPAAAIISIAPPKREWSSADQFFQDFLVKCGIIKEDTLRRPHH